VSGFAATLVRGWTWLYTSGLSSEQRARRRREIESDLWESSEQDAIVRLVRGMPADLGWRIEQLDGSTPWHSALQLVAMVGFLIVAIAWVIGSLQPSELPRLPVAPVPAYLVDTHPPPPPPPPPPPRNRWMMPFNQEPTDAKQVR
jgi:hypothetical protein